jgi:hypothetical protein
MSTNKKEIIVLGAGEIVNFQHCCHQTTRSPGVVGLTTALKLQQAGKYRVTIVAEVLPSDPKSGRYTSFWAVSPVRNPIYLCIDVYCRELIMSIIL